VYYCLLENGAGTRGRQDNERILVVVQGQEASIGRKKWGRQRRGGDARTAGQRAYIGGGTGSRSVYRKEKMGAPKKPPMYLHVQTAGGAHRVGYNNMKCQHCWRLILT